LQLKYYQTVWLVMIFGWVTNYMVRAGLSPVLLSILDEFSLDYSQAGLIAAAVFYSYAGMQLPAGIIGDRLGRKVTLVACSLGWGITSLLTSLANSFASLFAFRFLTGLTEGMYFSNDRSIISHYTPRDKAGLGQGFSFSGLGLGMTVGILLAGVIAEHLGWRWVFILFSIPSFLAAFLILKFIKEPERPGLGDVQSSALSTEERRPFSTIFKTRGLQIIYGAGIAAIYGQWMLGAWAPAMFKEVGVEELSLSSFFASILGLSAVSGLIVSGYLSDRLNRIGVARKTVVSAEFVLGAASLVLVGLTIALKGHYLFLIASIFCSGFFLFGLVACVYPLVPEIAPPSLIGSTFGLGNSIHYIGGFTSPWVTGLLKDWTGSFAFGCYFAALLCVAAAFLMARFHPPGMKRTH
jgi:MFS family permease